MNVHILITTCERRQMLLRLLRDLAHESRQFGAVLRASVFDDATVGDPLHHSDMPAWASLARMGRRSGKEGYWRLVTRMFSVVRALPSDTLVVVLPDDAVPVSGFLGSTVQTFEALRRKDHRAACLSLLSDGRHRSRQWLSGDQPQLIELGGGVKVWSSMWFDMCGVVSREAFEVLSYRIDPVDPSWWAGSAERSSGVGRQITQRLTAAGLTLYHTDESLIHHGTHPSVMHAEHRRRVPLETYSHDRT